MDIKMLKKILEHNLDSGVSIVTCNDGRAHIANVWVSYVRLANNDTLYMPVGGMKKTEEFLDTNENVIISLTNREIQGKMYNGTGVIVSGKGKIIYSGEIFDNMKKEFDWIRAILKVKIDTVTQVL